MYACTIVNLLTVGWLVVCGLVASVVSVDLHWTLDRVLVRPAAGRFAVT